MFRAAFFAIGLSLVAEGALSFDLNDCIISGMKGVSSDIAARQVRYACDQKRLAFRQARLDQISQEFGEPLEADALEEGKYYNVEEPGFYSMQYLNKSKEMTVTLIRLAVSPAPGGPDTNCDPTRRRVHTYKVTLKPRATVKLVYPSSVPSNCTAITLVLARPPSWKDVSFSSSAKPSDRDPFVGLD